MSAATLNGAPASETDLGDRVRDVLSRRAEKASPTPTLTVTARAILAALAVVPDNAGLTATELAEFVGTVDATVHHQLARLADAKKVISDQTVRVRYAKARVWRLP